MFEDATFDSAGRIKTKNKTTVMISFILEVVVLLVLALIPLVFTEALPARGFLTMLMAPPPPPPPPPPPAEAPRVRVIPRAAPQTQQMVQPKAIPRQVAIIEEAPSAVVGGVVGGVVSEAANTGSFLGSLITAAPPPPPPPKEEIPEVIRVGGQVQAAKMINQVQPPYPPLARQARIQGTVRLEAIIDKDGNVKSLTVVSGHPLLVQSALDAVSKWKYQPTLLNGVPVEVATTIDVNFVMR
ncbi:MAG: energy transducer TonB [Acidobacteria bacterium]|nr:energy transducer TonB [Acidobacteriota bacterium]